MPRSGCRHIRSLPKADFRPFGFALEHEPQATLECFGICPQRGNAHVASSLELGKIGLRYADAIGELHLGDAQTATESRLTLANVPKMGMFIPNMGTPTKQQTGLAEVLFSPVLGRVLGLLFGQPARTFQSAEIIRLAGSGTGAAHRVLTRLASVDLVTVTRSGNQKHYQANRSAPVFVELHRLVVKTIGVTDPVRNALHTLAEDIHAAFVYGSVAKGTDKAGSDIDLMVVSDRLSHADLFEILEPVESALGRSISPTVMSPKEWRTNRANRGSFASRITAGPKLFVFGDESDLV